MLTPPALIVSSFISIKNIKDINQKEYHNKFGSLFGEFKNNKGFLSTQYYTIFFIRRLFYLIAQVYLNNHPYVQCSVHIVFTAIQIGFLIYYMPFKEIHIFISVFTGELVCALFIVTSIFFIGDISTETSALLEKIMIFSVLGGMAVQFFVSIYSMMLAFKLLWKKLIKYRAQAFLKSASPLGTIAEITLRT